MVFLKLLEISPSDSPNLQPPLLFCARWSLYSLAHVLLWKQKSTINNLLSFQCLVIFLCKAIFDRELEKDVWRRSLLEYIHVFEVEARRQIFIMIAEIADDLEDRWDVAWGRWGSFRWRGSPGMVRVDHGKEQCRPWILPVPFPAMLKHDCAGSLGRLCVASTISVARHFSD